VAEYTRTQRRLRRILYRFDCPSALTIGEYVLDLTDPFTRTQTARHVLECSLCEDELKTARAFMATDLVAPAPGVWQGLRRVVASFITPVAEVMAYGMARGSEPGGSQYRAGPVKIVVGSGPGTGPSTASVDGLLLHDFAPPEALADREVALLDTARVQDHVTRTDDLGGFAFEDVASGTYTLEVSLSDEVVVVEDLRVGG
jgi:hypothetical protein